MDDIRPIQELADAQSKSSHLFPVRQATLWHMFWRLENLGDRHYRAKNPEYGANINFYLADTKEETTTAVVNIHDASGKLIRTLKDTTVTAGINRIVWDLGHEAATKMEGGSTGGFFSGQMYPFVAPGTYTAKLEVNGSVLETPIAVRADPRIELPQEAYVARTELLLELREQLSKTNTIINTTNTYQLQLKELAKKLEHSKGQGMDASLMEDIASVTKQITEFQDDILKRPPPAMNYRQRPRLREEIRSLMRAVNGAVAKPTQPQYARLTQLKGEVNAAQNTLNQIETTGIQKINDKAKNIPQISVGE